jgi:hypothetical protein
MSRHPTSLTKGLSLLRSLLEAATARVPGIVKRHDGDAYDKSFKSWERLVTLIYTQLSGTDSLRGIETGFNANAHHHYHFGVFAVARSTLSDANARPSTRKPKFFPDQMVFLGWSWRTSATCRNCLPTAFARAIWRARPVPMQPRPR